MTRFLLDISTVLGLLDPGSEHHEPAHAWAARATDAMWLTCPIVQNGVIRIASQPAYPGGALGTATAVRELVREFCDDPRHAFCPDDVSVLDDGLVIRPDLLTPHRITDVYLLALARRHGARLATCDRKIAGYLVQGGSAALELIAP